MHMRTLTLVAASMLFAVPAVALASSTPAPSAPSAATGQNAANEGGTEDAAIDSELPSVEQSPMGAGGAYAEINPTVQSIPKTPVPEGDEPPPNPNGGGPTPLHVP